MGTSKKTKKEEMIPIRRSVHVIYLSCPHCSFETDNIKLCPQCNEPMKVIDVVEKFGDDADRFLERLKKRKENGTEIESVSGLETEEGIVEIDKEEPNIILMGADESLDEGIDPVTDADDASLDVIFPDDDEEVVEHQPISADDDLAKALDQLDSEEEENVSAEDFGFGDGEIPEL